MLFILLWEGFSLCVSVSVQGPVSLATANDAISAKQGRSHQSGRWNLNKLFLWVRPSEWGGIWGIGDSSVALWCAGLVSFSPRPWWGMRLACSCFFIVCLWCWFSWWLYKLLLTLRQMLSRDWQRGNDPEMRGLGVQMVSMAAQELWLGCSH